jgi:hypothetical protein
MDSMAASLFGGVFMNKCENTDCFKCFNLFHNPNIPICLFSMLACSSQVSHGSLTTERNSLELHKNGKALTFLNLNLCLVYHLYFFLLHTITLP